MSEKTITGAGSEITTLTGNEAIPCSLSGSNYWFKPGLVNQITTTVSKSEDYTITDDDGYRVILVTTGATDRTMTLPTAADNVNRTIKIIKVDSGSGTVTIDGEGAETINGVATKLLTTQYSYMEIQCDGTEWFVVDYYHAHYATAWTAFSDQTNVDLTATHNFSTGLSGLRVGLFVSTDNTDANAFQVDSAYTSAASGSFGFTVFQDSADAIHIQTGAYGFTMLTDAGGVHDEIAAENYYYKIVVEKIEP